MGNIQVQTVGIVTYTPDMIIGSRCTEADFFISMVNDDGSRIFLSIKILFVFSDPKVQVREAQLRFLNSAGKDIRINFIKQTQTQPDGVIYS